MSPWFYISVMLWLLGAIAWAIEFSADSPRWLALLFGLCWPLVMVWALARWAAGK